MKSYRTLYYGVKLLSNQEFQQIIKNKETNYDKDLCLIGCLYLEDELQNNLSSSIEIIQEAGIKMWMLTGDKNSTAQNVAFHS